MGYIQHTYTVEVKNKYPKYFTNSRGKEETIWNEVEETVTHYENWYYCSNCGRWNPFRIDDKKFIHQKISWSKRLPRYIYIIDVLYCPRCGYTFELTFPHVEDDPLNYGENSKDKNFIEKDVYGYEGYPKDGGEVGEYLKRIPNNSSSFPVKPWGYYEEITSGSITPSLQIPKGVEAYKWFTSVSGKKPFPYWLVILLVILSVIICVCLFWVWFIFFN